MSRPWGLNKCGTDGKQQAGREVAGAELEKGQTVTGMAVLNFES